jgi:Kef-type K+ transport system membrane component KefB
LIHVDTTSFFLIVLGAAFAAVIATALPPRLAPPVVVLELLVGIAIGPHGFGWATDSEFIQFFSNLGLGLLFFFAGYEIDFERIRGTPLRLGARGWGLSIAIAYALGGVLALLGVVDSLVYVGSAMATTAIGTLIPILRDNGELDTRFGTYLLGAGAIGEFGPILLITLFLSTEHPAQEALILILFVVVAIGIAVLSTRAVGRGWSALERTLESSNQLAIRVAVLLIFGLLGLAGHLGLDILLGGFVAGMITRLALKGHEVEIFESKLSAVGFGFLIPFFFIHSGMTFDLGALGSATAIAKLLMFFALFLVVRGFPAMALYRDVLDPAQRRILALYSATELPLVVAITTLAVEAGKMDATTSASLVGAAMLSTLVFPFAAIALQKRSAGEGGEVEVAG